MFLLRKLVVAGPIPSPWGVDIGVVALSWAISQSLGLQMREHNPLSWKGFRGQGGGFWNQK